MVESSKIESAAPGDHSPGGDLQCRLREEDQLCFIHIPKTAGTTLTSILDSKFDRDRIFPEAFLRKLQDYTPQELAAYRLFRGHFSHAIGHRLPRSPYMITMLRDPVERAISAYEFMKTCIIVNPQAAITQQKARSLPLKDYIRDPAISGIINGQTRQLAGRVWQGQIRDVDPAWLEAAQAHLADFAFVGLTEQFNESMDLLNYTFGWSPLQQIQQLMVGRKRLKREQLTAEELEIILEHNQLDVALYDYAKALFEQRYQAMLERLERYGQTPLPEKLEQHYQACLTTDTTPTSQITFTFEQGFSGSGWHGWEGEHRHLPFRWTGPGLESTLDFPPLQPDTYRIELRVINAITPEVLSSLKLHLNGTPLHLISLYCDEDTAVLRGTIPPEAITKAPFTRLTFSVSHTRSLQSVNPAVADRRAVGVALDLVQIYPASASPAVDTTAFLKEVPQPWQAAEAFLHQHMAPQEVLFAPNLFRATFASTMPSEATIPQGRIANYGAAHVGPDTYQWAVLHKGMVAEIGPLFLELLFSPFRPVFANAVFIVFTTRNDVPRLGYSTPHVRYAYSGYIKHQLDQRWQALTQGLQNYGKSTLKSIPGFKALQRTLRQQ